MAIHKTSFVRLLTTSSVDRHSVAINNTLKYTNILLSKQAGLNALLRKVSVRLGKISLFTEFN